MTKHISFLKILLAATLFCFASSIDLRTQNGIDDKVALRDWIALDAPPGREHI